MCESHADKFVHFDRINRHDIDFVSTDFLAPDYRGQGRLLAEYARADGFVLPASADEGAIRLGEGQSIVPKRQLPAVPFGALYLELEAEGSARIELGGQTFTLDVPDKRTVTHQVLTTTRTCPAHHGARRRDHPHGDTGEGRSASNNNAPSGEETGGARHPAQLRQRPGGSPGLLRWN